MDNSIMRTASKQSDEDDPYQINVKLGTMNEGELLKRLEFPKNTNYFHKKQRKSLKYTSGSNDAIPKLGQEKQKKSEIALSKQ